MTNVAWWMTALLILGCVLALVVLIDELSHLPEEEEVGDETTTR